jgi:hypothetical protein
MSTYFSNFFENTSTHQNTQNCEDLSNDFQDTLIQNNSLEETDCGDVASVDTCLNIRSDTDELDSYGLTHLFHR